MDKYDKVGVIGRGSYGMVILYKRKIDDRQVIVKQIPTDMLNVDEQRAVQNEVKIISSLDHPNIVQYYDSFFDKQNLMIVMEFAAGGNMSEYLRKRASNPLTEEEVKDFFAQILMAIHHMHTRNILHRDLKTENILLDYSQQVIKLGDFGISTALTSRSMAVTVIGTPNYLSPELCDGKPYNQKSDIWALGCILFELIANKRAFEAATLALLVGKISGGSVAPLLRNVSRPLEQVMRSMLNTNPCARPSATALLGNYVFVCAVFKQIATVGKIRTEFDLGKTCEKGQFSSFEKLE